ncbi:hypothetical protein GCM10029963_45530 [Micromonospora andamanensis]
MTHPADPLDPPRCCALYLRRSHRNAEGDARNGRSLAEQETELRDLAARLGLIVVYVFIEREGTGASRFSLKARPEWKKALEWLRVGDLFRTLLTWSLDRADRRGAVEIGKLLDEHADGSRRIVGADGTDTGDPRRRLELIIRAEIAREEVENLSRRVSRTKRFRRAEGRWLGGPPPFGLRIADGQLARDPDSYPVARRIADELLAGRTIWQTVKGLNDSGIPSPRGKSWGSAPYPIWSARPAGRVFRASASARPRADGRRSPSRSAMNAARPSASAKASSPRASVPASWAPSTVARRPSPRADGSSGVATGARLRC